jgi:regulator of replication initiation timing
MSSGKKESDPDLSRIMLQKLQTKVDSLLSENASMKRELEFLKQKQDDSSNALSKAKEQAASQIANSGTAESKLRVAMIEIETLKL